MINIDKQQRLTYKVVVDQSSTVNIERMCSWCQEHLGRRFSIVDRETFGRDGVWQCIWQGNTGARLSNGLLRYTFSFDHEQDAVLFALRWA
jgi:hypothetical protein